jgi:hypothetical protein
MISELHQQIKMIEFYSPLNLVSAVAIGLIISVMALIHDVRLKALVYSFPIPITIALIATHGVVTAGTIFGLANVCGFLWLVYILHQRRGIQIVAADILGALVYVIVGYGITKLIHVPFYSAVALYIVFWVVAMVILQRHHSVQKPGNPLALPVAVKGIGTTAIAYILFTLKDLLSAIVVTFPFSGVFTVIEAKQNLSVLARVITRNSLAILGLFVVVYALGPGIHLALRLIIGWVAFGVILKLVQKIRV